MFKAQDTRQLMGTFVTVTVYDTDEQKAIGALEAAYTEMLRVQDVMNRFDPESELSKLNETTDIAKVSDELFMLLDTSIRFSILTDGAFDVTVGPLMKIWKTAWKEDHAPDEAALQEAREKVGYRKIKLDNVTKTVKFETPGMVIDLGGIAKGYAADRAVAVMSEMGIQHALVDAGGDVLALGMKPDGEPWKVAIRDPKNASKFVSTLHVFNEAATTSGDYEQFIESGGKKYSHIFDPRTGETSDCVSATVITRTALEADALSTSICVMGPEAGIKLIESIEAGFFEAYMIDKDGNEYKTSGFDRYVK